MSKPKIWTGERLETSITNEVMLEHLHRYALAQQLCKDKKVLDIACGEGYGSNLLAHVAKEVIGIDLENETIIRAKKKYTLKNIQFKIGSILDIPVKDSCIDIITSFETLEHISDHEKAMNEFKRVLCPSGLLMISTPEKRNYSDKTGHKNPFHEKELYGNEFKTLLQKYFKEVKLFGQYSCSESVIYDPNQSNTNVFFTGDYKSVNITQMPDPVYWVAMASDNTLPAETNSSFLHLNAISELLQEQEESIKKTKSYRVGNFILYPFKRLKFLLSK